MIEKGLITKLNIVIVNRGKENLKYKAHLNVMVNLSEYTRGLKSKEQEMEQE